MKLKYCVIIYDLAIAVSGLVADSRILVEKARVESTNHWFNYNSRMSIESITKAVSKMALSFAANEDEPAAMVLIALLKTFRQFIDTILESALWCCFVVCWCR